MIAIILAGLTGLALIFMMVALGFVVWGTQPGQPRSDGGATSALAAAARPPEQAIDTGPDTDALDQQVSKLQETNTAEMARVIEYFQKQAEYLAVVKMELQLNIAEDQRGLSISEPQVQNLE